MNNTDKLLRALIDALGFDVETTREFNKTKFDSYMKRYDEVSKIGGYFGARPSAPKHPREFEAAEYKLTKRDTPPFERVPVNYKELLDKYVTHVHACEGDSFTDDYHTDGMGFNDAELTVLRGN